MDRTQAFLDSSNIDFTWPSNWISPKGLAHDFGLPVWPLVFTFFLQT